VQGSRKKPKRGGMRGLHRPAAGVSKVRRGTIKKKSSNSDHKGERERRLVGRKLASRGGGGGVGDSYHEII